MASFILFKVYKFLVVSIFIRFSRFIRKKLTDREFKYLYLNVVYFLAVQIKLF